MVLADAPMQTSDTDALALGDVFQAAMAGVQEYQRVQIESSPPEKVNGAAAADVVHLMTELVDNALAFSPPTAPVKISTKQAGDSTIVEISDGGLGIAQDVLNSLNEDLRSGGEVTAETARRMGLLVVSRIATRHGITVSLARNPRGGTTATVLLPPALLRGQQTPVLPKQRPGLAGLTPAKSVLPAAVTERLTNEAEPKKLPTRPEPAAPAAPAAAAAVAASPSRPPRRAPGRPRRLPLPHPRSRTLPRTRSTRSTPPSTPSPADCPSVRPAPPAPAARCPVRRSGPSEARCSSGSRPAATALVPQSRSCRSVSPRRRPWRSTRSTCRPSGTASPRRRPTRSRPPRPRLRGRGRRGGDPRLDPEVAEPAAGRAPSAAEPRT